MKTICNKIAKVALCDVVYRLSQGVFLAFKMSCVFLEHVNIMLSDVHKKNAVFPIPISTKLATVEQYYVQISYTKFHINRTNIASRDVNLHTPPCKV